MELAHVVHRVATDPTFAALLLCDPQKALVDTGLAADEETVALTLTFLRENPDWMRFRVPAMQASPIEGWFIPLA